MEGDNSEDGWDNRGKEWASSPSEGIKRDWRGKANQRMETRLPKPLQKLRDQNGKLPRRRLKIRGVPAEGGAVTKGGSPRERWLVCPFPGLQPREALVLFWIRGTSQCLWLRGFCHPWNSRGCPGRVLRQQLSELSKGNCSHALESSVPIKVSGSETNTDNKDGDNVLKLGSQESPINLELTRQ